SFTKGVKSVERLESVIQSYISNTLDLVAETKESVSEQDILDAVTLIKTVRNPSIKKRLLYFINPTAYVLPKMYIAGDGVGKRISLLFNTRLSHLDIPVIISGSQYVQNSLKGDDLVVVYTPSILNDKRAQGAIETANQVGAKLIVFTAIPNKDLKIQADMVFFLPGTVMNDKNGDFVKLMIQGEHDCVPSEFNFWILAWLLNESIISQFREEDMGHVQYTMEYPAKVGKDYIEKDIPRVEVKASFENRKLSLNYLSEDRLEQKEEGLLIKGLGQFVEKYGIKENFNISFIFDFAQEKLAYTYIKERSIYFNSNLVRGPPELKDLFVNEILPHELEHLLRNHPESLIRDRSLDRFNYNRKLLNSIIDLDKEGFIVLDEEWKEALVYFQQDVGMMGRIFTADNEHIETNTRLSLIELIIGVPALAVVFVASLTVIPLYNLVSRINWEDSFVGKVYKILPIKTIIIVLAIIMAVLGMAVSAGASDAVDITDPSLPSIVSDSFKNHNGVISSEG
ncbi:MAG: hypothetical protein KAJ14_16285, partial [Candidatus Omnitrophica bacterium]|nr:hypothetical protein [Candidatus Omnitrophota bacterium]